MESDPGAHDLMQPQPVDDGIERWPGLDEVVDWLYQHEIVRAWATFHVERPPGSRRAYAAACLRLLARTGF
jgi:hypothetical protein